MIVIIIDENFHPQVLVFTTKDIEKGDEMTVSYGKDFFVIHFMLMDVCLVLQNAAIAIFNELLKLLQL